MLSENAVWRIFLQLAVGVHYLHDRRILHRDLKPANILFNKENEPKLVDFGLAVNADADQDLHGTVWGTPYYIAPEKVKREGETFLSDMYSLAGTLYHALTGHVPFEAPSIEEVVAAHVHTDLTPPNHVVQSITQPTSDAIYRLTDKWTRAARTGWVTSEPAKAWHERYPDRTRTTSS